MAPLCQAIHVQHSLSNNDGVDVYKGIVDPDWAIGRVRSRDGVPHGGYVLALVLQACMMRQASTLHPDPVHVTAHYLRPTAVAPFEIHVRLLRNGRGFANVSADLIQGDRIKVTTHIIFGDLSSKQKSESGSGSNYTLAPPSPYSRRLPLYTHPSTAVFTPTSSMKHWKFRDHVKWAWDPILVAKNLLESPTRTDETTVGGGGVEWGAWFELKSSDDIITTPTLAFLVDLFIGPHILIPKSERGSLPFSWFPTMTLTIEFKFPIPTTIEFARRTVGLYSCSRYINQPQGRHDASVEVWTAPSNIGEGKEETGWREKQLCLAISTQMALVIPQPRASQDEFPKNTDLARL